MLPIAQSAAALLDKAKRCRRLVRLTTDGRAVQALTAVAFECEARAEELMAVVRTAVA
jgi:hypothetical protein